MNYTEIYEGNCSDSDSNPDVCTTWENWLLSCIGVDCLNDLRSISPKIADLIEDCESIDDAIDLIKDCESSHERYIIDCYVSEYREYCDRTNQ